MSECPFVPREIVDRVVTPDLLGNYRVVSYIPDLTGFRRLVKNWYTLAVIYKMTAVDFGLTEASLQAFAERFLATYAHICLNEEYKLFSIQTDSTKKLLASIQIEGGAYPRWLIDVCREICRPMAYGSSIFIPVFGLDFDGDNVAFPGTGLSPQWSTIWSRLFPESDSVRPVVGERLVVAPFVGFLREGVLCASHSDLATFRREAMLTLQTCRQGCVGFRDGTSPPVRKNGRGQCITPVHDFLPNIIGQYDVVENLAINDVFTLDALPAVILNRINGEFIEGNRNINIAPQGQPEDVRLLFYPRTNAQITVWVRDAILQRRPAIGLPSPVEIVAQYPRMTHYSMRFPGDTYHSRTPQGKGPTQKTTRSKGKFKAKVEYDDVKTTG